MGFNLGHWLQGAAHAVGKEFDHLATGVFSVAKAAINQPVAIVHELSGAVQGLGHSAVGVPHEASGAIQGVSSALSMPIMLAGGAALVFMMTRR